MTRSAMPYRAVAREGSTRAVRLPIDSPTLLTRRRYGTGSMTGFVRTGTLAPGPTGEISPAPWNGQGSVWPQFPHVMPSDVGVMRASITGLEGDPDLVKMPQGIGANYLVNIAHRSTYPSPSMAATAARDRDLKQRPRSYALPFTIGNPSAPQQWPTSSQYIANMMAGTSDGS